MSDKYTKSTPKNRVSEVTLEEARQRYEDEERRRSAVESKIGTIITVDALIVSIVGVFSSGFGDSVSYYELVGVALAIISVAIGLWTMRTKDYNRPGKDIDDFLQYGELDDGEQRHELLLSYIVAIDGNEDATNTQNRIIGNRKRNDQKYTHYDICGVLTGLSLLAVIAQPAMETLASLPI